MDREYLIKHNLMESHNKFMRMCNEGYLSEIMNEDGEDQQQDPNAMGGAPAADPSMGGDPNAMGGDPNAMGGAPAADPSMGGDPNAMGGAPAADPSMGGDPNAMGGAPAADPSMGGDPSMMGPDPSMNAEPEDDNSVIDVEDITSAQEKLNNKENEIGKDLGNVDSRIETLMTALEKMKGIIDHNNEEITALKSEITKRIPTQTEKLAMQSLHSYPYNVDPKEYWDGKEKEGIYQATDSKTPKSEYEIKREDIDNFNDSDIENSFDNSDLHQTMKDIFRGF